MKITSSWHYKNFWHRLLGIKTVEHDVYTIAVWQTGLFGHGGKWVKK